MAGELLQASSLSGGVLVWHDMLYEGPREPGWPTEAILHARAKYLEGITAGGLSRNIVLTTLETQYQKLTDLESYNTIVLWFDACLFDQSMLAHILCCLDEVDFRTVELLCVDRFPGIEPFNGLGQLNPQQLVSLYPQKTPVTDSQFKFAREVDKAFALQSNTMFHELARMEGAPLPWVPAAVTRWLQEQPDPVSGFGRLEQLALDAVLAGNHSPKTIFDAVAAGDTPPQYWGDITLWAKINGLADRDPPLFTISGPQKRLPQWMNENLQDYTVSPTAALKQGVMSK